VEQVQLTILQAEDQVVVEMADTMAEIQLQVIIMEVVAEELGYTEHQVVADRQA
jgi:hypothetical protein